MSELYNNQHPQKRAFLAAYIKNAGNITKAARAAKIERTTHYLWLREDAEYVTAFEEAKVHAADTLEDEATRRAFDGVEKPIYQQGAKVGTVREYSDTLLIFMLKGNRPDKYRERSSVEHSGKVDLGNLTLEELYELRAQRSKKQT